MGIFTSYLNFGVVQASRPPEGCSRGGWTLRWLVNLVAPRSASCLIRKSVTRWSLSRVSGKKRCPLISRLRMLDGFAELWPTSSDQRARELLPPGADETGHFGWMPVGDHVDESSVLQNTSPAGPATFLGFLWGLGRRLVHPLAHSWPSHGG